MMLLQKSASVYLLKQKRLSMCFQMIEMYKKPNFQYMSIISIPFISKHMQVIFYYLFELTKWKIDCVHTFVKKSPREHVNVIIPFIFSTISSNTFVFLRFLKSALISIHFLNISKKRKQYINTIFSLWYQENKHFKLICLGHREIHFFLCM